MNFPNCIPQDIYQPDDIDVREYANWKITPDEDFSSRCSEVDTLDLFEIDREMRKINKLEQESL